MPVSVELSPFIVAAGLPVGLTAAAGKYKRGCIWGLSICLSLSQLYEIKILFRKVSACVLTVNYKHLPEPASEL